jgi:diguanylate cyclase (GGDEF)-like protein
MPDKANSDLSYQCLTAVLDGLDAMVYVSDMDTHILLYINKYGRNIWGDVQGETCWKVLQKGQKGPCSFCTNHLLLDKDGQPAEAHVWEFQNTVNNRWYQCHDQAIPWLDGRIVRMEIATDITELKNSENKLLAAKKYAEELANKDALTSLNNRRAFFKLGNLVFKQAVRFQHSVSVIMIDIDHFKNINDNYGHSAGDYILREISNLLQTTIREIDILARIGGEEFALVLPETNIDDAHQLAERIRQRISDEKILYKDETLHITSSLGISSCTVTNQSLEDMLIKADDALYIAKKKGRNQVKTFS